MKSYATANLRNVVLLSHEGAGKTSLAEAALFDSGAVSRLGRVEDGTTASDFEQDERDHKISLCTAVLPVEWRACKINLLDTPGYPDFIGELRGALRVADAALLVIDAAAGVEVGTEMAWSYAEDAGLPRLIFVNRLDRDHADFIATLGQIRERLTRRAVATTLPFKGQAGLDAAVALLSRQVVRTGGGAQESSAVPEALSATIDGLREALVEAICETDDALLAQFLEGDAVDEVALQRALHVAVCRGDLVPVLGGSATGNVGVSLLLDALVDLCPSPAECPPPLDSEGHQLDEQATALVFKTVSDPFGRRSFFRVYGGHPLKPDAHLWNAARHKEERLAQLLVVRGAQSEAVPELAPGDIGAVLKLSDTLTGDTLTTKDHPVALTPIDYPAPAFSAAVEPKTRADLDRLGTALTRLTQEDPTLHVSRDPESAQTILSGMGETHLQVALERLHRKYQVDVKLGEPQVAYRETITGRARAQGRHKKQTGGHGQFGDVWLSVAPLPRGSGVRVVDKVVGGAIPRNFIPAVEKGVHDALQHGTLTGYPVVDIEVTIDDGAYHPVDSSEMAFKIAGALAVHKAIESAHPLMLEPIMHVEVRVPNDYTGDVLSDLNGKRAHILGMEPVGDGDTLIQAHVPQREMGHYAAQVRSITQGRGLYTMSMEGYEEAPSAIVGQIIAEVQAHAQKEHV